MSRAYVGRAAASKELQAGEKQIYVYRHHAIVLTAPIATALGAGMAGASAGMVTDNKPAIGIVWLLCGLLILGQILACIRWFSDFVIVTSRRLILSTSPVANQATTIELSWTLNVNFQRSWRGYLLGYGSLAIKVPGEGEYNVDYIKYSEALYNQLSEMIQAAKP